MAVISKPEDATLSEDEKVAGWRLYVLTEAGYPVEDAEKIAASTDIDLHRAVALLDRGCPVEVAVQILL